MGQLDLGHGFRCVLNQNSLFDQLVCIVPDSTIECVFVLAAMLELAKAINAIGESIDFASATMFGPQESNDSILNDGVRDFLNGSKATGGFLERLAAWHD